MSDAARSETTRRCVWPDGWQITMIRDLLSNPRAVMSAGHEQALRDLLAAWDAAPEPAEAIDRVLTSLSGDLHRERLEIREAVLRALGWEAPA